jgi:hypothetical protein
MSDQFRELLAPLLARVQAIAASRPELNPRDCRFTVRTGAEIGIKFAAFLDCGIDDDNTVGTHGKDSPEEAIAILAREFASLPGPPTLAELIAIKRAELAKLEAGQ